MQTHTLYLSIVSSNLRPFLSSEGRDHKSKPIFYWSLTYIIFEDSPQLPSWIVLKNQGNKPV